MKRDLPPPDYLSSDISPRRVSRLSLLQLMQSPAGDNSAESTAQKLLKHVAGQLTGHVGDHLSVSQIVSLPFSSGGRLVIRSACMVDGGGI